MHQVNDGPASQSYGLQVAALAGVPATVIDSAKQHLRRLENQSINAQSNLNRQAHPLNVQQFDLFAAPSLSPTEQDCLDTLKSLSVDDLTPKQALEKLYELTENLKEG